MVDTEMLLTGLQHRGGSPDANRRNLRAQSQDRILGSHKELGLSTRTALNDRYFDGGDARSGAGGARSRSLDNLIENPSGGNNFFGLSESKLNRRYLADNGGVGGDPDQDNLESISQRGGRWEDVGLSVKTPLNDRYFSQPDLGDADATGRRGERSKSQGNLQVIFFRVTSSFLCKGTDALP